eukprot:1161715-Pelagomonas_calceolata.AAC.8
MVALLDRYGLLILGRQAKPGVLKFQCKCAGTMLEVCMFWGSYTFSRHGQLRPVTAQTPPCDEVNIPLYHQVLLHAWCHRDPKLIKVLLIHPSAWSHRDLRPPASCAVFFLSSRMVPCTLYTLLLGATGTFESRDQLRPIKAQTP